MRCNLSFNPLLKCVAVTKLVHTCLCHLKTVIVMYAVCMTLTAPNFLDYTTPPFFLNCNYYPVNHILVLRKPDRSNLNTKKNKSNFHPKKKNLGNLIPTWTIIRGQRETCHGLFLSPEIIFNFFFIPTKRKCSKIIFFETWFIFVLFLYHSKNYHILKLFLFFFVTKLTLPTFLMK